MKDLYENYAVIIIFLHIISAVIWVGGMIAIRFAVHPSLQSIEEVNIKLGKTILVMGKFFNIVLPFIFISLATALVLLIGGGFNGWVVHAKESIWTIMSLNFAYMYFKRYKAMKLFSNGDLESAKQSIAMIPSLLLPINIALGLLAIFFGITFRAF